MTSGANEVPEQANEIIAVERAALDLPGPDGLHPVSVLRGDFDDIVSATVLSALDDNHRRGGLIEGLGEDHLDNTHDGDDILVIVTLLHPRFGAVLGRS